MRSCSNCKYQYENSWDDPCCLCPASYKLGVVGQEDFTMWEPKNIGTACREFFEKHTEPATDDDKKEEKTMLVKEEAPMPISEVVRDILNSLEMMDINLHGIESAIMGGGSDEVALKEAAPNRNGLNNDIHLIANAVYNLNNRITALRAIL